MKIPTAIPRGEDALRFAAAALKGPLAAYGGSVTVQRKRCAAGTLTSLLKIGRDHLPVADAGDKDAPWSLFALSL